MNVAREDGRLLSLMEAVKLGNVVDLDIVLDAVSQAVLGMPRARGQLDLLVQVLLLLGT